MELICSPKTLVPNKPTLCNIPEDGRIQDFLSVRHRKKILKIKAALKFACYEVSFSK
jgi:hypothetical protein